MELPGKMQFTLVAFYGSKPPRFSGLIRSCQDELARLLLASFHPYDIDQVHGTLIGLEGVRQGETTLNSNFNALRSEMRHMDLRQILGLLSSTPLLPMKLQIGGFRHYEHFDFTSRGLHPYLRSFAIRDRIAVAMGWPTDSGRHPASLDELRRVFQNVNVLHQYHQKETDKDNDFFFVLGRVDRSDGDEFHIQKAEEILRNHLAAIRPFSLSLGLENLSLVGYLDTQLPTATSCRFPVDDALKETTQAKILTLYSGSQ